MEAMLALVLDLHGWRGPVAFAAAGIFTVVLLARLLSWAFSRRIVPIEPPAIQGYKSREEIAKGLREEPLADWLQRMNVTAPELKVRNGKLPAGLYYGNGFKRGVQGPRGGGPGPQGVPGCLLGPTGGDGGSGAEAFGGVDGSRPRCLRCMGAGKLVLEYPDIVTGKQLTEPCTRCRGTGLSL